MSPRADSASMSCRIVTVDTPNRSESAELRTKPVCRTSWAMDSRRPVSTRLANSSLRFVYKTSFWRLTFQFETTLVSSSKVKWRPTLSFETGRRNGKNRSASGDPRYQGRRDRLHARLHHCARPPGAGHRQRSHGGGGDGGRPYQRAGGRGRRIVAADAQAQR